MCKKPEKSIKQQSETESINENGIVFGDKKMGGGKIEGGKKRESKEMRRQTEKKGQGKGGKGSEEAYW